ncbi:Uncharacterised protein [Vibrio cholerae]|nr:Uncharacterised protein [Vibrio cholerae]
MPCLRIVYIELVVGLLYCTGVIYVSSLVKNTPETTLTGILKRYSFLL